MIISHKYKFIYIKNAKVAGSSFEKCIKPYLGNEDIIIDPSVKKSDNSLVSHDTIENVQKYLDPIVFQNYFKFCIERDPFEKVLSSYFFVLKKKFNKKNKNLKFILFMKPYYLKKSNFTFFSNYFRYSSNGKVLVNYIMRYENINNEIKNFEKKFNLPNLKFETFKEKSGLRDENVKIKDLFSKIEIKWIIFNHYDEIKTLGYRYNKDLLNFSKIDQILFKILKNYFKLIYFIRSKIYKIYSI